LCGRRPFAILAQVLAVKRPLNLRHRFAFVVHRHRVTRDVEADVSCESHAVPLRLAVRVAAFDETIADAIVPEAFATAVTRRVLPYLGGGRGYGVHRAPFFDGLRGLPAARQWRPGGTPGGFFFFLSGCC